MKGNYDFYNMRKGYMFYIPKTNFEKRIVVIGYDSFYVYCIDLNKTYYKSVSMAHIKRLSYEELNNKWVKEQN